VSKLPIKIILLEEILYMKHILYPDGAVLNMMVTGKMKRGMEIIHSSISGHVDDGDWV
jgi:hypothetical protein